MALPVRVDRGHAFDPFDMARSDLGSVLNRFFGAGLLSDAEEGGPLAGLGNFGVDIREDADHIYVVADLPGFRKEDVDISLENGTLTITAERSEEITVPPPEGQQAAGARGTQQRQRGQQGQQGEQGQPGQPGQQGQTGTQMQEETRVREGRAQPAGNYLLRERRVRRFVRSFTLPPNVDERNVEARLENGVLTIVLNKREESKPKHIRVS
jgi:HSP20 family protein